MIREEDISSAFEIGRAISVSFARLADGAVRIAAALERHETPARRIMAAAAETRRKQVGHLVDGEFQSDKYPTCPRGKVPLSTKDPSAQDLLWEYAQRRRSVDPDFARDLEAALVGKGFQPPPTPAGKAKPAAGDRGEVL